MILVPLSQEYAKIFNMAKQISFQNYLIKTKHKGTFFLKLLKLEKQIDLIFGFYAFSAEL